MVQNSPGPRRRQAAPGPHLRRPGHPGGTAGVHEGSPWGGSSQGVALDQIIATLYTWRGRNGERYLVRFTGEALEVLAKPGAASLESPDHGGDQPGTSRSVQPRVAIYSENGGCCGVWRTAPPAAQRDAPAGGDPAEGGKDAAAEARAVLEDNASSRI